jgi:hypothetical protein
MLNYVQIYPLMSSRVYSVATLELWSIGEILPPHCMHIISSQKDIYNTLKQVYEDCLSALVADLMRHFQNKKCGENESVCIHFEQLTNF